MKNAYLLLAIIIFALASCGKKDNYSPTVNKPTGKTNTDDQPAIFKIKSITTTSPAVIAGQRVNYRAELTDSSGNINYEWKLFYNNKQFGNTVTGLNLKSIKIHTQEAGEYTLRLTITRGSIDKDILETKILSKNSNFQYGVWGDNEETIKTAEADNGNSIYDALIGIPMVTNNNEGLTTLTYKKAGKTYSYYFKSGKLYAGAYTITFGYFDINTSLISAYSLFDAEKLNTETLLGITFGNDNFWLNDYYKKSYDTDNLNRSRAIGLGYLRRKVEGVSSTGSSTIELYKQTSTIILFSYILVSPTNQ